MKLILSPAKSLDLSSPIDCPLATEPLFNADKEFISNKLKKMSAKKIAKTFGLSEKLSNLNYERFQNLRTKKNIAETRQAIFTFDGDVFQGFNAYSLNKWVFDFSQSTVRILSGLYGVLKPFDLIEPYRLEMGAKLPIGRKKNLYQFWSEKITISLNAEFESEKDKILVNLASNEYSKAIDFKALDAKVVNVNFLEEKGGELKNISFFSKKARGLLARYIVDHKISKTRDLKGFDYERYALRPSMTTQDKLVFTRKYQPKNKK